MILGYLAMNILKEYSLRNKINEPIVYHVDYGVLILKNHDKSRKNNWFVFSVNNHDFSQGEYEFAIKSPNKFPSSQTIINLYNSHFFSVKTWDQYESFFYNLSFVENNFEPIFNKKEIILAAWEMFIFINESWFLNQNLFIKNMLFETLDIEKSLKIRYDYYEKFLALEKFNIFSSWQKGFLSHLEKNYLHWYRNFL